MTSLERLAHELRAERSLLAETLVPGAPEDPFGASAEAGPRAAEAAEEYALVLAAVREGYLLHYGEGRVVRPGDPDLALLGGDRLYALGLARLAALGDLAAVSELADLISLCAQAHAEADPRDPGAASELADAAWEAAAVAIGHGATPAHAHAKERARAGDVDAAAILRHAASTPDLP